MAGSTPACLHRVKDTREQMPQVMGEDLPGVHAGKAAQPLHRRPNLFAVHGPSASGEEELAGGDFFASGVFQQLAAQLAGQQDGAYFAL